jgi:predicted ferric reductase
VRLASLRGPLLIALLCAVPPVLWVLSTRLDYRFIGPYVSLTSIAVLLALAGTSAFALNLVLGARLPLVEAFFGGLERMYGATE